MGCPSGAIAPRRVYVLGGAFEHRWDVRASVGYWVAQYLHQGGDLGALRLWPHRMWEKTEKRACGLQAEGRASLFCWFDNDRIGVRQETDAAVLTRGVFHQSVFLPSGQIR